jgi:hypothetical protein
LVDSTRSNGNKRVCVTFITPIDGDNVKQYNSEHELSMKSVSGYRSKDEFHSNNRRGGLTARFLYPFDHASPLLM